MGEGKITLVLNASQFALLMEALLSYEDEGPTLSMGWQSKELNDLYEYVDRNAKNE